MNIKFIINVALDVLLLWPCIALAGLYGNVYAENAISFYGIFSLIVGSLLIIAVGKMELKPEFKRTKSHLKYMQISSWLEVLACAIFGWYWVAAGFTVFGIAFSTLQDRINKEHPEF